MTLWLSQVPHKVDGHQLLPKYKAMFKFERVLPTEDVDTNMVGVDSGDQEPASQGGALGTERGPTVWMVHAQGSLCVRGNDNVTSQLCAGS